MVYVILLYLFQIFSWCSAHVCINHHIRKCTQTIYTVPQCCQQLSPSCLFLFSWFFLIFSLYLYLLPYLEICTDHEKSTPTLSTTVYIMSILFLLSFPNIFVIFLLINILGNAHRPYQQYTNIVDNDLHLSLHFSWFLPWFSHYLCINYHIRSVHRPCKQYPNIITTIPIFFWFYYYFSCENAKVSIFGIFYLNSGHWILVPFRRLDSGDHTGVNTGITQFHGRMAGKFCWNSTRIHRND